MVSSTGTASAARTQHISVVIGIPSSLSPLNTALVTRLVFFESWKDADRLYITLAQPFGENVLYIISRVHITVKGQNKAAKDMQV